MLSNKKKALIHIAKSQVGMTDAEYLDILGSVGVSSSADPAFTGEKFSEVMEQFKRLGFKKRLPRRSAPRNDEPVKGARSRDKMLARIEAILVHQGLRRGYADSMARHMFGIDRIEWLDADQVYKLLQALEVHRRRKAKA